jgi:multiple sugar transport system substrate-binding protein
MKAGLFESSWQQSVYQGSLYAMPYSNNAKWLFWNTEMMAAAGIEKPAATWDEFVSHSQAAIDAGLAKYGTSWGWMLAEGLTCDWTAFLHGYGGKWRASEDGQTGDWMFNGPEGAAALEFMMSTIAEGGVGDPGSLELNDRTDLNTFMAGDTLYNVNWSYAWWFANDPNESKIAGKMAVGIWPAQSPVVSSSVTGGGGFGVMANTSDRATAWKYIEIATNEENAITRIEKYSDTPPWKELYTDEAILAANPQFAEMGKQYEYTHFRPVVSWYTEWSQNMQTELHNAFTGAKSAQQALDDAVTFSNAGSEKYKS